MSILISGKEVSEKIRSEIKIKTENLFINTGIRPGLAMLLVGEDPASKIYVSSKEKACAELGFYSILKRLPSETPELEVLSIIESWNNDPLVHGILVQMPLPSHIDSEKVIMAVSPRKDVDGFHPENVGRLVIGLPGFVSCTPAGIMELLKRYEIPLKGKHVVVLGRSNIVGKPIANLLYQKNSDANAIVTICHTAAKDVSFYTKHADIIIAAMGRAHAIGAEDVKEGVTIIDVGINRIEDSILPKGYRIVGDVDFEAVNKKAYAITPVPGGVGPMTISMLMSNTYKSASGEIGF